MHSGFLALMGRAPHLRLWHPLWPNSRYISRILGNAVATRSINLLLIGIEKGWLAKSLTTNPGYNVFTITQDLLDEIEIPPALSKDKIDLCIIQLDSKNVENIESIYDLLIKQLSPDSKLIFYYQNHANGNLGQFSNIVARIQLKHGRRPETHVGGWTWAARIAMLAVTWVDRFPTSSLRRQALKAIFLVTLVPLGLICSLLELLAPTFVVGGLTEGRSLTIIVTNQISPDNSNSVS
jgi:hypothetical protein